MSMINIPVWMFLSSYEKLRNEIINKHTTVNMAHCGRGIFGSDFGTTTFVIQNGTIPNYFGTYKKLYMKQGAVDCLELKEQIFLSGQNTYYVAQDKFKELPGAQYAYWICDPIYKAFAKARREPNWFFTKSGLTTGDNDRFLKVWFEIDNNNIYEQKQNESVFPAWYFHLKGGSFRKWSGNLEYILHYDKASLNEMKACAGFRNDGKEYFFREGLTWGKTTAGAFSARYSGNGVTFNTAGCQMFAKENLLYLLGCMNSKVMTTILDFLCPSLSYAPGDVQKSPVLFDGISCSKIENIVEKCIKTSDDDWNSFETSWGFTRHPLVRDGSVAKAYALWERECNYRFNILKANEEELNRIFINIYGLQDELTPEVADKDVTVRKADLGRDIRSLLSYAVGCMFGRYSLNVPGLAYAGGDWDDSRYSTFIPDKDNILPITDEEYFEDDIVGLFCAWLKKVYGTDTLEENLDFIAKALGNKGNTSREVIRNYFLNDFFKDHCSTYSVTGSGKRPIYWLFDSGKQNGFKALIYMHRYDENTIGNLRIDYLHRMERVYDSEIARMQDVIDNSSAAREVTAATKRKEKLQKQIKECKDYDEKIAHLALARIAIDLDDGVKVNYEKVQTVDGKKYPVLAQI